MAQSFMPLFKQQTLRAYFIQDTILRTTGKARYTRFVLSLIFCTLVKKISLKYLTVTQRLPVPPGSYKRRIGGGQKYFCLGRMPR